MSICRRLSEIERADPKMSITHFPDSVSRRRTQGDVLPAKGATDEDPAPLETDRFAADTTNYISCRVVQFRQPLREKPLAHPVARSRDCHPQRLVRTLAVIDLAPPIKSRLAIGDQAEGMIAQQFLSERAMKALVLALRLRVVRARMRNEYAQPQQPDGQHGVVILLIAARAPRHAVVHRHPPGQPIAAEGLNQGRPYGLGRLITAGLQNQGEARMIIERSQRIAATGIEREVAFEIHLPQIIRRRVLESLPGLVFFRLLRIKPPMSAQDLGDRARRRRVLPAEGLQAGVQFPPSPGRMLISQFTDRLLDLLIRTARRVVWTAGAIRQTLVARGLEAFEPLVTSLATDREALAQPAEVDAFSLREPDKFTTLGHQRIHFPGHLLSLLRGKNSPLKSVTYVPERLLPMSPVCTRQPVDRSIPARASNNGKQSSGLNDPPAAAGGIAENLSCPR